MIKKPAFAVMVTQRSLPSVCWWRLVEKVVCAGLWECIIIILETSTDYVFQNSLCTSTLCIRMAMSLSSNIE